MKKTAIALAMALTGFATAATAAPLDNTWYTGAKVGWSNYHDTGFYNGVPNNNHDRPHQLGAGAYVGYQANQYVGFEFGYDWLGRNAFKDDGLGNTGAYKAHVLQLAAKLSYPIMNDLDIYTRLGAAGWRADASTKDAAGNRFSDFTTGVSPMAAVGLEYAITPSIATRLDYQWINNIGDGDDIGTRPDNGMLSLGLAYRFGQDKPAPVVAVPVVETKRFTLKSDVLFAFNKSNLKPEGQQALDQLYGELSSINPQDGAIVVLGYTDRIGSEQYNQKLSEQRAQSVVSYLVGKGIPADKISARGLGKSNPVTGSTCDGMKRGAALIDCLAPDRRVEIEVKGAKDIVTQVKEVVDSVAK